MKKLILIVIVLVAHAAIASAQSTSGEWQLQNPAIPSASVLMGFGNENFIIMTADLKTGSSSMSMGECRIQGDKVTFTSTNGRVESYTLTWFNPNKFSLDNAEASLIFAKSKSSEDTFLENYNQWQKDHSAPQDCHACKKSGKCAVCGGTGKINNKYNSLCPSCLGSGVCKYCEGTGKFVPR